jgi:hypothetical protein
VAKGKDPADIGKEQGPDALRGITDRDPDLSFEREEPTPRPNGRHRKANGEDQARKRKGKARKATVDAHADGGGKPVIRIARSLASLMRSSAPSWRRTLACINAPDASRGSRPRLPAQDAHRSVKVSVESSLAFAENKSSILRVPASNHFGFA